MFITSQSSLWLRFITPDNGVQLTYKHEKVAGKQNVNVRSHSCMCTLDSLMMRVWFDNFCIRFLVIKKFDDISDAIHVFKERFLATTS